MTKYAHVLPLPVVLFSALTCGTTDPNPTTPEGTGGAGSEPTAEPTSTMPGSAGMTGTAGQGGGAAGGPTSTEPHCMPDEGIISSAGCFDYDAAAGGIPDDPDLSVFSTELAVPMAPGQPYAASLGMEGARPTIEWWGTDESCGHGNELLASRSVQADGTYCFEFLPTQAHTHVLLVFKEDGGGLGFDEHYCPAATCP